jgi:hypothetical protein
LDKIQNIKLRSFSFFSNQIIPLQKKSFIFDNFGKIEKFQKFYFLLPRSSNFKILRSFSSYSTQKTPAVAKNRSFWTTLEKVKNLNFLQPFMSGNFKKLRSFSCFSTQITPFQKIGHFGQLWKNWKLPKNFLFHPLGL